MTEETARPQEPQTEAPSQTAVQRPRLSTPGSTLEDLQNDEACLGVALWLAEMGDMLERGEFDGTPEEYAVLKRWVLPAYENGAGAFESSALVAWLKERVEETQNTIDALDGSGMPALPTATVLVTIEGGVVQDVSADTPGVRVILQEYDDDMDENPAIIEDDQGHRAYMQDWEPSGNDLERAVVARSVDYADLAGEQIEAVVAQERAEREAKAGGE